jgi:hypothetical protein
MRELPLLPRTVTVANVVAALESGDPLGSLGDAASGLIPAMDSLARS